MDDKNILFFQPFEENGLLKNFATFVCWLTVNKYFFKHSFSIVYLLFHENSNRFPLNIWDKDFKKDQFLNQQP